MIIHNKVYDCTKCYNHGNVKGNDHGYGYGYKMIS